MKHIARANPIRPVLFVAMVLVSMLGGCEQARGLFGGADEASEAPPVSADFEVNAKGVLYATLLADGRLDSTDRLSRIPLSERAATVVHIPEKTPQLADRYYVADLLDSTPGDAATATLRSVEEVRVRLDAGKHGALGGLHTLDITEQMLGISPSESGPSDAPAKGRASRAHAKPHHPPQNNDPLDAKNDDHVIELFDDDELSKEQSSVESEAVGGHAIEIRRLGSTGAGRTNAKRSKRMKLKPSDTSPRAPTGTRWRPVTLYYAEWCGVCVKAKSWLDANRVPYKPVDIDASKTNQRQMVRFCRSKGVRSNSIPTFRIGDDVMQGWSAGRFIELAKR